MEYHKLPPTEVTPSLPEDLAGSWAELIEYLALFPIADPAVEPNALTQNEQQDPEVSPLDATAAEAAPGPDDLAAAEGKEEHPHKVQPDQEAEYLALIEEESRKLFSFFAKRFGYESAEDLVQGTWELAFQYWNHEVRNRQRWLYGIAKNVGRGSIHKEAKQLLGAVELLDEAAVVDSPLESEAAYMEREVALWAFKRLSDQQREILGIGMRGETYQEFSDRTGMPIGSIGPTAMRARKRLAELLLLAETAPWDG